MSKKQAAEIEIMPDAVYGKMRGTILKKINWLF